MSNEETGPASGTATSDQFAERPPDEEVERIETERAERLDPENRPDHTEVDNTQRDFDSEAGMFTDSDGYEQTDKPYDDEAGEMKAPDSSAHEDASDGSEGSDGADGGSEEAAG